MKKMETAKDFSWHKTAENNLFERNYQQFGIWYLHFYIFFETWERWRIFVFAVGMKRKWTLKELFLLFFLCNIHLILRNLELCMKELLVHRETWQPVNHLFLHTQLILKLNFTSLWSKTQNDLNPWLSEAHQVNLINEGSEREEAKYLLSLINRCRGSRFQIDFGMEFSL